MDPIAVSNNMIKIRSSTTTISFAVKLSELSYTCFIAARFKRKLTTLS